jgi:hypothetical protein
MRSSRFRSRLAYPGGLALLRAIADRASPSPLFTLLGPHYTSRLLMRDNLLYGRDGEIRVIVIVIETDAVAFSSPRMIW